MPADRTPDRAPADPTPADRALAKHMLGVLVRPAATFRALADQTSAAPGASAIALLGIFWSVLLVLLWLSGERPSFVLLPIPREHYYLIQGVLMTPILTALFWIHGEIAHRICARSGGTGTESGARTALGFAYAAPMSIAHVIPELIAYLTSGFATMAQVGRVTLPIAALWVLVLSVLALRIVHRVRVPIAIAAALVGLVAQALAGGLVIR